MLQIARVQKEDAGRYTCQAVNEAGEDHMHFELHILGMYIKVIINFILRYGTHARHTTNMTFQFFLTHGAASNT